MNVMLSGLIALLRKTQVILLIVLFAFSLLLLMIISYLFKVNMSDIFSGYQEQNLQTIIFVMMDDMRQHDIARGPLTQEQADWIKRRSTLYGVLLQYREGENAPPWIDTFSRNSEAKISQAVTSPYILDGSVLGYLTIAYSGYKDALNPINVQYQKRMQDRSRILVAFVTVISLIFSFLVARFLSNHLARLADLAHQIRLGKRDISAPLKGPEEVRRLALTLNEMSQELNKQEAWREHLMEDLAHELRTPLTSMLSQIEAIIDGIYKPDTERMNEIYEELERLSRLLNDLQKLSEAESAQFSLQLKRTNMVHLARRVYQNFLPMAAEKGIRMKFEPTHVPSHALVDRDKMVQVVANIVSNAIKYTPAGGRLTLSVIMEGDYTLIRCSDNGVGIAEQDQPYVFNRLYRADKSRSRFSGGVGLGLSIAKALAEAHGSRIELESVVGTGSTFTVVIPNEFPADGPRSLRKED